MTTRDYTLRRGTLFTPYSTVVLVFLWAPLSQLFFRESFQVVWLGPPPFLVLFWYLRLKPVARATISDDGTVCFHRGLGKVEVQVHEITRIYPAFWLSRRNFLLKHSRSIEYLLEDPTLVAVLARDLVRLNPNIELRRVPRAPGETVEGGRKVEEEKLEREVPGTPNSGPRACDGSSGLRA